MAEEETLLEFPCQFSVKAMGINSPDFNPLIYQLVASHVSGLTMGALTSKPSSKGKYTSVTVTFTATSKAQLDTIYRALSGHEKVLMAL